MKLAEVPFAVLRFQYQIARMPFQLIEEQMAAGIDEEAPARLVLRTLAGISRRGNRQPAGRSEVTQRGTALVERSDALSRAAKLDAKATAKREQADAKLDAAHDNVVTDIKEARDATEQEAIDARITAAERKRAADEAAENRAAAAKKQADDFAAQRKESGPNGKASGRSQDRPEEKNATEAARAKLDDAGQARRSRTQARAGRPVEELADAEKEKRKSERAKNNSTRLALTESRRLRSCIWRSPMICEDAITRRLKFSRCSTVSPPIPASECRRRRLRSLRRTGADIGADLLAVAEH